MSNTSSSIFANASALFADDNNAYEKPYAYDFENARGLAYDRDFTDNPVTSVLFGCIFVLWCALAYVSHMKELAYVSHMKKTIKSRSWISAADVYVQLATISSVIGSIFDNIKEISDDNKKTIRRLKKKNRQMKSIIAVTDQQIESYKDERDNMWTEYDTMYAKMQRSEDAYAKVNAEIGEYCAIVKEVEEEKLALNERIDSLEEEKLALRERIDSLEKCNNTLQCQLCDLAAQITDKEKRKAEKRNKKKQCRTIIDEEDDEEEEEENHAAL